MQLSAVAHSESDMCHNSLPIGVKWNSGLWYHFFVLFHYSAINESSRSNPTHVHVVLTYLSREGEFRHHLSLVYNLLQWVRKGVITQKGHQVVIIALSPTV